MTAELQRRGVPVNHKHVLRLMREESLLVQVLRYCQTTNSRHSYGIYPNLLKGLEIVRPNQVWTADLTYIRLQRHFVYLAVLLDVFTRAIRGWELSGSLSEELSKAALQGALAHSRPRLCPPVRAGAGADQHGSQRHPDRECLCRAVYAHA
jgi:putative transposase